MEENSLIAALRKAETEKFAAVPPEEKIEHAFSDRFREKMDRLIRLQGKSAWQMVKNPVRRSLLLLLILLLTFGVPPEKNPLFRLAQQIPELSTVAPAAPEISLPQEASTNVPALPEATVPEQNEQTSAPTRNHNESARSPAGASGGQTEPGAQGTPTRGTPNEAVMEPEDALYVPPATASSAAPAAAAGAETTYAPVNTYPSLPETVSPPEPEQPGDTEGSADAENKVFAYSQEVSQATLKSFFPAAVTNTPTDKDRSDPFSAAIRSKNGQTEAATEANENTEPADVPS